MTLDGPASFLIVFGLLGVAFIGAVGFLVSVAGTCHPRYRHRALGALKFGSVGGAIAFVAMALLYLAVGTVPDAPRSLFFFWTALAFFAGFAAGAMIY